MAVEAVEESGQEQPIDLLVSLAKDGEIDPWNVDVVEVTDHFLKAVNAMDRRGLKVCAETLLYASVLLRMKSEAILEEDEPPEPRVEEDWEPAPMNPLWTEPPELEPPVRREAPRPATLDELIDELKNAARRVRLREERMEGRDEEERITQETVRDLPHEEQLEERVEGITERVRRLLSERDSVTMESMLDEDTRHAKVSLLLPLLFMSARGVVELEQETLYGEVEILPGEELRGEEDG